MQYLLLPLLKWTEFVGSLPWSNLMVSLSPFFIIAWVIGAVLSSKYIFTGRKAKIATVSLWVASFVAIVVLCLV
jgi:hypothetical protein